MFEQNCNYPCAVTNSSAGDPTAIALAHRWVRQHAQPGQTILLWTPQKSSIARNREVEAISRQRDVVVGTSRGRYSSDWSEGPVLGLWHDTADLARMPMGRPTAMCLVPWVPERLAGWVRAVGAEIIGDGSDWAKDDGASTDLDPVVVRGLESMTLVINHSNTIKAGYEKRDVVGVLLALRDAGYSLPAEGVRSWAIGHGWRAANANHLADYCNQIERGSRPRFTGPAALRPDLVDTWRDEVAGRNAS